MTYEIYFAGEPADGLGFFSVDEDGNSTEYYPTKKALRAALADGSAWGFQLAHEPATIAPPEKWENNPKRAQRVLLTGLDCLPGQEQLFDADGTT